MDELPINWTYPEIQPKLLEEAGKRGFLPKKEEIKWLFLMLARRWLMKAKFMKTG